MSRYLHMEKQNKLLLMFITGQTVIYTFIILLQLMPKSLFWILLVLMHLGIVIMIISKKKWIKNGYDVRYYYKKVYILLLPFLPVMFYKLLSGLFAYEINQPFVLIYTIIISIFSISLSIINVLLFRKYINNVK